jgi:arylsulfatase A-like enzyme
LKPGIHEELYDLKADPEELINLAADVKHRSDLERLRALALEECRRTEAGYAEFLPKLSAD